MSDVSGIPYMGTMGMGNFFAPPYGGGGMNMSAGQISSTYMPEIANNQNVVNNLFNTPGGGGGFGRATDYYSQLGANYLAAVPSSWNNPYTHGAIVPQSLRVEGGNYANSSPFSYQGGSVNAPMADINNGGWSQSIQGPNWGGGGGLFSSGLGGGYNGPSIDWGGVGSAAAGMGSGGNNYDFSSGMFGGLGGGIGGTYHGPNTQLDWSHLFDGGGGGVPQAGANPYTSGIEPDQTGGRGLDAPMAGAPSSTADWSTLFDGDKGMTMPGGLNSPMTVPEQYPAAYDYGSLFGKGTEGAAPSAPDGTRTYDLAPMFEGGGGGFGTGGADTSQLFGAEATGKGGNAFSYNPDPTGAQDIFSQPAEAQAAQARARLADLIGGADKPIELKVDPTKVLPRDPADATLEEIFPSSQDVPAAAVPTDTPVEDPFKDVPQPVTPDATTPATDVYPGDNPPRPPEDVPIPSTPAARFVGTGTKGTDARLHAAVRGAATFLPPGYTVVQTPHGGYRAGQNQSQHGKGKAMDIQIIGPDGAIPNEGPDHTGMYTLLARGVKTWVQQNDPELGKDMRWGGAFGTKTGGGGGNIQDLMHFDLGYRQIGSYGRLQPEVGYDRLRPLSAEERGAMPANIPLLGANQVALDAPGAGPMGVRAGAASAPLEQRSGVNQGQNVSAPPADIPPAGLVGGGFNALDAAANAPAAAVKHSGLELARANIDTPIEQIARERFGQKGVDEVSSMVRGMTPRQIYETYGGMFTSRAEPLFKGLGITRQDFEKAASMPQSRQDLKMRFAEMEGGFGPYPAYTGPEAAPGSQQFNYDANVWEAAPNKYADFRQSPDVEDRRGQTVEPLSDWGMVKAIGSRLWDIYGPQGPQADPGQLGIDAGGGVLDQMLSGERPMPSSEPMSAANGRPQERIDPTAPWTPETIIKASKDQEVNGTNRPLTEIEGKEVGERFRLNVKAREEGRPELPLYGPAPGRPDLPPKLEPSQLKTLPSDETGLPDLPFSAAPRSDLGTGDVTDFSAQSRRGQGDMPDRGMDPSYWADVLGDGAEPPGGAPDRGMDPNYWADVFGDGAAAPASPAPGVADEYTQTRSIFERASSPAAERMQRLYGGVGDPGQYSGFEQPYGPEYQPGEYMREQFKNRADFTLQDQAEKLAGQRERAGTQIAADPELRRNVIATVLAEMGPNQTDENRLKVIESALNRLAATNYPTGMYKILGYRNAAGNYDPAGSPIQQSHQERQYYEPFKYGERGEAPAVRARGYDVMRDQPELAEHVGKLLDAAIKTGTNVSNLATENSSDPISARQLRLGLQSPTEWATIPGSGPELFSRKDIATPAARQEHGDPARYRSWLASLMPPGYQWQQQPVSSIPNFPARWR